MWMKIYKFVLIFFFVFIFLSGKQLKAEIDEEAVDAAIKEDKAEVKIQKSNETGIYIEVHARPMIFSSDSSEKAENFSPEKDTTEITGSIHILEKSNEIE